MSAIGIALNRDLIPDIDNPSIEVINHAISVHANKIKHWDRLEQYYLGEHEIFKRMRDSEKAKNTKVMINHAKYITDTVVGFFLGNAITYSPGEDGMIDELINAFEVMDISSHDTGLGHCLSVFGECLELPYLKAISEAEVQERITVIDPREGFLVVDDTIEQTPLFGVHFHEKKGLNGQSNGFQYSIYTPNNIIVYRSYSNRNIELSAVPQSITPHYWGDVPLNEVLNNKHRQGDFEQLLSLIDAFNNLQSDRISDKEAFIESVLIVYGFILDDDNTDSKRKLIEAPAKTDGAQVDWLTKTFNESEVQVLAQALEDNIHKISFIPNLNDQNFHGNVSGVAMKFKLFGLLMLLATKTRYLTKAIRRRLTLMENMLNIRLGNSDQVNVEGVDIKITPNIPVNVSDVIDQIKNSQEFLPLIQSLSWLPDVSDPEKVIEQLREQQREEIEMNRDAMGFSPDNRDFDDEEEEFE